MSADIYSGVMNIALFALIAIFVQFAKWQIPPSFTKKKS